MKSLSDVTAVILAGGFGTRLRSVVPDCPKILAKIQGKFFLTFLLDCLIMFDFQRVVLCTGYLADQINAEFGGRYGSLLLVYSKEISPLGTGGALRLAHTLFQSDEVFVMNGDSFCYTDLTAFRIWHEARKSDASLILTRVNDVRRFGQVVADNDGRILRFEEKNNNSGPGWINAGMYMINKKLIEEIPDGMPISLEKDIFPSWMGKKFYGFRSEGRFTDIGTPESYAEAEKFFQDVFVNSELKK